MPIYEYQCRQCGHRFERLVRNAAMATGVTCDRCGDPRVEKQFSTFGVSTGGAPAESSRPPSCGRCGEDRPPCHGGA